MKKVTSILAGLMAIAFIIPNVAIASAQDITTIPAPEGLMGIVSVLPILIILFYWKRNRINA